MAHRVLDDGLSWKERGGVRLKRGAAQPAPRAALAGRGRTRCSLPLERAGGGLVVPLAVHGHGRGACARRWREREGRQAKREWQERTESEPGAGGSAPKTPVKACAAHQQSKERQKRGSRGKGREPRWSTRSRVDAESSAREGGDGRGCVRTQALHNRPARRQRRRGERRRRGQSERSRALHRARRLAPRLLRCRKRWCVECTVDVLRNTFETPYKGMVPSKSAPPIQVRVLPTGAKTLCIAAGAAISESTTMRDITAERCNLLYFSRGAAARVAERTHGRAAASSGRLVGHVLISEDRRAAVKERSVKLQSVIGKEGGSSGQRRQGEQWPRRALAQAWCFQTAPRR